MDDYVVCDRHKFKDYEIHHQWDKKCPLCEQEEKIEEIKEKVYHFKGQIEYKTDNEDEIECNEILNDFIDFFDSLFD